MSKRWAYLTLLGLLCLGSAAIPPAAAQVQTSGEIQAYGHQTTNYGVGCTEVQRDRLLKPTAAS